MNKSLTAFALVAATSLLAACGGSNVVDSLNGKTKFEPSQVGVKTNPALAVPPNLQLRPPSEGPAPVAQQGAQAFQQQAFQAPGVVPQQGGFQSPQPPAGPLAFQAPPAAPAVAPQPVPQQLRGPRVAVAQQVPQQTFPPAPPQQFPAQQFPQQVPQPFPGQAFPQPVPQQFPQPVPQQFPQQVPQPFPGQPVPQPFPGQPVVGQPFPGQPFPQAVPQPFPGQPFPGQPVVGQPFPGQPFPGQPVFGQPFPGQPVIVPQEPKKDPLWRRVLGLPSKEAKQAAAAANRPVVVQTPQGPVLYQPPKPVNNSPLASNTGDAYARWGISRTKPNGKKKTQRELDQELRAKQTAENNKPKTQQSSGPGFFSRVKGVFQ